MCQGRGTFIKCVCVCVCVCVDYKTEGEKGMGEGICGGSH